MKYDNIHSAPIGEYISLDGTFLRVVYRDTETGTPITVLESFGADEGILAVVRGDEVKTYKKYCLNREKSTTVHIDIDAALARGEDILAKEAEGKSFYEIKDMLPQFYDKAYIALGHPSVERMVTVDRMGNVFRQKLAYEEWFPDPVGEMLYRPEVAYGDLGKIRPTQSFLDKKYPILFNVHESDDKILESLYVYDTGTFYMGSAIYIRNTVFDKTEKKVVSSEYRIFGVECYSAVDAPNAILAPELFYDSVLGFIDYCEDFEANGASVRLPIKELERSYIGTLLTTDCLFNGERARYGHRIYGPTYHDFFPPNYIAALWAYAASGQSLKAGRMAEYILANVIDNRGRVRYRQGDANNYGFSASEISQLLWVIARYYDTFEPKGRLTPYTDKILAMGDFLLAKMVKLEELDGISVIRTCAEADTNERIHDYLENTLWGIRGLESIISICKDNDTDKYAKVIDVLMDSVRVVRDKLAIDSEYGKLVPFRLDYSALPLTLAKCEDTAYPVTKEEMEDYLGNYDCRSDTRDANKQDFHENTYANYRYYPEILSSCLLGEEYEKGIMELRKKLGGEILGMVRWYNGMDDWPAYNLALYYIERGEIEKFRMLLYAHACHHGLTDFHIYYEQVKIEENQLTIRADSSVPSILLNNIMINLMFAHVSLTDGALDLLKGIPAEWVGREEFSIENACTPLGAVSVSASQSSIRVKLGDTARVRLWLNGLDDEKLSRAAASSGAIVGNGYIEFVNAGGEFTVSI